MKKGFTLIELLAVIVILAIIALIATPIILGIINDAREDANKRSVENYAHAVELAIARDATKKGGVIEPGIYEIVPDSLGKQIKKGTLVIDVDYKGEAITKGNIIVLSEEGKEGQIELSGIEFGNAKTKYNYSETAGVTKSEKEVEKNEESSPFKVSDSGVLLHYERQGNETSVVVPAEVNGIKIRTIAEGAFMPGDIVVLVEQGLAIGLTEHARLNASLAEQFGMDFAMIDEFGHGNDPVTISINAESNASGGGKMFIVNNGVISSNGNIENYYLTDLDLSEMKYLESISYNAFRGLDSNSSDTCYSSKTCPTGPLKSLKLPMNGVLTTIGADAFKYNSLEELTIPSTVRTICNRSFSENKIKKLTILDGVTTIGWGSFYNNSLENVIIPSSVTSISGEAFAINDNLKTITIKRASADGMTLDYHWNGTAEVIYDTN